MGIIIGCLPPAPVWRLYVTRICLIQKDRIEVLCTFNIILDTFILILPQRVIWKLQMSRKRNLAYPLSSLSESCKSITLILFLISLEPHLASSILYSNICLPIKRLHLRSWSPRSLAICTRLLLFHLVNPHVDNGGGDMRSACFLRTFGT